MDIEVIWERINECEGQIFRQIKGKEFFYMIRGNSISLSSTNRLVSKSTFCRALNEVPLDNTVPLHNLQAPSYLYAILMDKRIRMNDW